MGEDTMVRAKIIRVVQGMSLVEWYDVERNIERHWVTPDMIHSHDSQGVIVDRPGRGIPFGDELTDGFNLQCSAKVLLRELHKQDIWSYADVMAKPNAVRSALLSAIGLDVATILRNASIAMKG